MIPYFENVLQVLSSSLSSIDAAKFDLLVDMCIETLHAGHKIVVSGLGKNVPVCDKFVGSMLSLGLRASFMHTNTAIHGDIGMVEDGDLVIVLSKSGETVESIHLTKYLQQRNIILWLLSFRENSTLSKMVDHSLIMDISHEGDLWNIMPNNSTTLNLIVLQGIVQEIAKKMDLSLLAFKRNHPGGFIGEQLKNV